MPVTKLALSERGQTTASAISSALAIKPSGQGVWLGVVNYQVSSLAGRTQVFTRQMMPSGALHPLTIGPRPPKIMDSAIRLGPVCHRSRLDIGATQ
jgi:hypothetical protein